jgi:hypothetical protein
MKGRVDPAFVQIATTSTTGPEGFYHWLYGLTLTGAVYYWNVESKTWVALYEEPPTPAEVA